MIRAGVASLLLAGGCAGAGAPPPVPGPPPPVPGPRTAIPRLISTEELAARQEAGERMVVLDVRGDVFTYLRDHLPGAGYVHVETLRAADGGVPTQPLSGSEYAAIFQRLGVRRDRPVVIYSAGETQNIDATFLAWILAGFGHPRVHLLDGGYFKWQLEQRPLARSYPEVEAASFAPTPFALERASLDDVLRAMEDPNAVLVDARPPDQYAGEAGAQMRRGHIPGAVSHYWQSDLRQEGFGKVWRPTDELRRVYEGQGITPERDIIAYCNSSTEASHVHFALRYLLGYPRVRIYTGSWTEWAERTDLPLAKGPEPGGAGSQ